MKKTPSRSDSPWIYGVHPVLEALSAPDVVIHELVFDRESSRIQSILQLAETRNIPVRRKQKHDLTQLVGNPHHQGVALRVQAFGYSNLDEALSAGPASLDPLVVLDCVQDPQNFGAILRSAAFLGMRGVIIPKDRSARVTAAVIKVAAGATAYLPVFQVTNLPRCLDTLKETGLWIVGLDLAGRQSLYSSDLKAPLALVVGNEQKGLRPLVRKKCDLLAWIPQHGPLQSLNASNAAAIAMAEVQRQRSLAVPTDQPEP